MLSGNGSDSDSGETDEPKNIGNGSFSEGHKAAFEKGELPPLESGAMSYMMSKNAYLTDDDDHNVAHLMFYTPPRTARFVAPICGITGNAESAIQRRSVNRRVYCSRGQMVRRNGCSGYVRHFI